MEYRATGGYCAVDIETLNLPISGEESIHILQNIGFELIEVDIIKLARECIDISFYRRGARLCEAPKVVDCSSFVKWLYAQRGILIPRRSIQQRELGEKININDINAGDLVFTSGYINYYNDNPLDGVGHVGIVSEKNTIIHAGGKKSNVTETNINTFIGKSKLRGIRRYIPKDKEVLTFKTPPRRDVETSDDFKWIILQNLQS
jgi:hypothetical protein